MAVITIYKCDRCGAENPSSNQMWHVGVVVENVDTRFRNTFLNSWLDRSKDKIWCRKCCDELSLIGGKIVPEDAPSPAPEPTLEDKIREIIRDEIENAA